MLIGQTGEVTARPNQPRAKQRICIQVL
jgi:hypothetical protein